MLPTWYQRVPFLPPEPEATPDVFTWMAWAVHKVLTPVILFLRIMAAKFLSSLQSMVCTVPLDGWLIGDVVVGTVSVIVEDATGVVPGFVIRIISSRL